ncbi:MAG: hypothetical protein OEL57_09330 [Trichlorobacter sp.]|uniref:hypothetical protein n=1 Tax=Trichlorobacter sp. TaxID=2911007 RepID=UPI002560AC4F|nr:hypothetical protein [Trichlorobacter sp.]MDK9718092.1 hypothetical protein [Trichlorobacter sp.]
MKKDLSLILSILAFILYIIGGLGIFSGLFMVLVLKTKDLFGLGTAETLGYLFLCVGGCLSVVGVLTLRIIRNRTNQKLYQAATC